MPEFLYPAYAVVRDGCNCYQRNRLEQALIIVYGFMRERASSQRQTRAFRLN
jgi:hypothetical protein